MPIENKNTSELMNFSFDEIKKYDDTIETRPLLRMKHISHLDLDGYGATILSLILKRVFPESAMTLEMSNIIPNRLHIELQETLEHIDDYDLVVITDLSINQKVVDLLKDHPQANKVRVFDHHICEIKDLPDNFTITTVSPIYPGKASCATELYFDFISRDKVYGLIHDHNVREKIRYFVEVVRAYDTFDFWKNKELVDTYDKDSECECEESFTNYSIKAMKEAPRLNTLFHILDREAFEEYIVAYTLEGRDYLTMPKDFDKFDRYNWIDKVIDLEENKNRKYVESALRRVFKFPFKYDVYKEEHIYHMNYLFGVVFAEKSSPIIANTYLERNEDVDVCAVVSNNQVSIYSIKKDIDVSTIAKIFNGGGHADAAGFSIPYLSASTYNQMHFQKIIECAGNLVPEDDYDEY